MNKEKYMISIIALTVVFSITLCTKSYAEYYNPVEDAVRCTDRAYEYAEKTCEADSLEEAQYYAEKIMKAVKCVKDAVYDVDALLLTYNE